MKERKTSRVLNDESYLLGLSFFDITGAGLFLLFLMIVGKMIGIQSMFWALTLTVCVLIFLVPIRLKFRRKIVRDSIQYIFLEGVRNVSKNSRK